MALPGKPTSGSNSILYNKQAGAGRLHPNSTSALCLHPWAPLSNTALFQMTYKVRLQQTIDRMLSLPLTWSYNIL